jgi:thioredoxin
METTEDEVLNDIRKKKMDDLANANINLLPNIPNEVIEIHSVEHFNQIVHDFKDQIIIVDFWAEWCGPCRAFAPSFKSLQHEYHPKGVVFTKLNVDHFPQISGQFNIQGIPTTMFIHQKKVVHHQVGMLPKPAFAQVIDAVLKKKNLSH